MSPFAPEDWLSSLEVGRDDRPLHERRSLDDDHGVVVSSDHPVLWYFVLSPVLLLGGGAFTGLVSHVASVSLTRDGWALISASGDGEIRFWTAGPRQAQYGIMIRDHHVDPARAKMSMGRVVLLDTIVRLT